METNCLETKSSGDELLKTSSKETNCLETKSRGTLHLWLLYACQPIECYQNRFILNHELRYLQAISGSYTQTDQLTALFDTCGDPIQVMLVFSFWREREISIGKNKEYKKEKIFYMDVLKTIHKKISNQKMKSKERDKSILEYVQCMYNNVHTYKVPGF